MRAKEVSSYSTPNTVHLNLDLNSKEGSGGRSWDIMQWHTLSEGTSSWDNMMTSNEQLTSVPLKPSTVKCCLSVLLWLIRLFNSAPILLHTDTSWAPLSTHPPVSGLCYICIFKAWGTQLSTWNRKLSNTSGKKQGPLLPTSHTGKGLENSHVSLWKHTSG